MQRFVVALARYGVISLACVHGECSIDEAYSWRKKGEDFREAWDQAMIIAVDMIEVTARHRAIYGVTRPIVQGGKIVEDKEGRPIYETTYPDRLVDMFMRGRRPDVFGQTIKHTGDPAQPIAIRVSDRASSL